MLADSTDYQEALRWIEQGLAHFDFDIVLKEKQILIYTQSGQYQQAIAAIDEAAQHSPRKEKWLLKKASLYELSQQNDLAMTAYEQALAALESLPKHLAATRKMLELETQILEGISRIQE